MKEKTKTIFYIILALIISSSVFFFENKTTYDPQEVYRVYLDGESIGLIYSKQELEEHINKEEEAIKKQYNVDKVYIPNNLDIVKEITYNEKIESVPVIYDKMKDKTAFTIKGYKITIKGVEEFTEEGTVMTDDVVVYVLDKQVFVDSITDTIGAFVEEEDYEKFINKKQPEIKDTGEIIEDVYLQNDILIKEDNISIKEQIFLNSDDLSKYLLFGTLEEQQKYTVKAGDTIESVSFNNKLSVGEFLIANEQFDSADNLLYAGQEVTLGIIKPAVKVVEEEYTVAIEESHFDTIYEDDDNLAIGIEIVKQNGVDGLVKVHRRITSINGDIMKVDPLSTEIIKPSVSKIIIRGKKYISGVGNPKVWYWPTAKPYIISSPYGWRWGKMHEGLDITGTGLGSPIYAANNGVVVEAGYTNMNGNYIILNHNNGYYSVYAHMQVLNVKKGQIVEGGQKMGTMGSTGYSTGPHLHFGIFYGYPFRSSSTSQNPMRFY